MQNAFPSPEDDDVEDVAWGLTTGAALWKQGERYDAIVWLKRAVEAANEAGAPVRADQLNRAATDLIASLAVPPRSSSAASLTSAVASPPRATLPSSPRAPTPPSIPKAAPVPPRPPPPPRLKTPPAFVAAATAEALETVGPRAPMPSVTTSAPTLEVLTQQATDPSTTAHERLDPPPPPTIVPDVDAEQTPVVDASAGETDIDVDVDATPARPVIPAPLPSPPRSVIDLTSVEDVPARAAGAEMAVDAENAALEPAPRTAEVMDLPAETAASDTGEITATFEAQPSTDAAKGGSSAAPPALVAALGELPFTPEQRRRLAETATLESLSAEEDVSVSCLALVVEGQACAQATVSDVTAVAVRRGELLYAKSSIDESLSLRLVAEADPTTIAHWDHRADDLLEETPDLVDRLKRASDRTQAIAGCTMGPLGEQLDEGLRAVAIDKLDVRVLSPGEVIAVKGQPVPGMVIVGVGMVEVERDDAEADRLGPGDFLFATEVLGGGAAPGTARAGAKGAIVLFGARAAAHELLVTCPPLLEVFAGM